MWGGAKSIPSLKCKEVVFTILQCCFVWLILSSRGFVYPAIPCRLDWPGTQRAICFSFVDAGIQSVHHYTWLLLQMYLLIVMCQALGLTTFNIMQLWLNLTVWRSIVLSFICMLDCLCFADCCVRLWTQWQIGKGLKSPGADSEVGSRARMPGYSGDITSAGAWGRCCCDNEDTERPSFTWGDLMVIYRLSVCNAFQM